MTINGENRKLPCRLTLSELLAQEGFQMERIAVELNGEIIPKSSYDSTFVNEGDKLEVVNFVGGG